MKSIQEIKSEIAALRIIKPTVLSQSAFGENHHDAIDAQIEVLENDLSEDDIYDRADEGKASDEELWKENQKDSALEARQWLEGESENESLIENWQSLVR